MTSSVRDFILERFRWIAGHADMWPVFRDGDTFKAVVQALASPFRDMGVTAVCGIESRGFLLGGAVAFELGVGFVAVRKEGGLFPGDKLVQETEPDYRGRRHSLRMQQSSLTPSDRVLLVDDWVETGSQALAVREMVAAAGADFIGCAVRVDQMQLSARSMLGRVHALVASEELPSD